MIKVANRWISALVMLLLPSMLCRPLLRMLGHHIGSKSRVGFSLILCPTIYIQDNASIGHFNLIRVHRLALRSNTHIGRGNLINGPISVSLGYRAAIGNNNKIVRGQLNVVTHGPARLRLGELTKITSEHRLDCTKSIVFGSFSTLAGAASSLWTHGYVHETVGPDRYRVDGCIDIGSNVYIGTCSIITAGVRISNGIIVGAGTTVAKNLATPGLYVSSTIRQLARPSDPDSRSDMIALAEGVVCERVYVKHRSTRNATF